MQDWSDGNVRPEERISAEECRTRLTFKSMRGCLLDRRRQWFRNLERTEVPTLAKVEFSRLAVASRKTTKENIK